MHAPQILALLAWLLAWALLVRVPHLPRRRREREAEAPPVTIVIPARNEAASLPNLLADLERGRPAGSRVVVVDDDSEDETAAVARDHAFVEVLPAPPLEAGWTGKAWACHTGAAVAGTGRLVFLDADVRLHGDALERALDAQAAAGGLVSVWPRHEVRRPYEHLSALFNTVAFMASGAGSLVPSRKPRTAFGPCLVTSTEAYRSAGGHASVKSDVIDDFGLARAYREAGLPVRLYGGGADVSFRMYPQGLGSLVEGWTKNFGGGALRAPWPRVAAIALWLACSIGLLTWAHGIPGAAANVLYALYATQMLVFFRQVGSFGVVDALLYPLHVAFFILVFVRSLYRTFLRRNVAWRGREVELGTASAEERQP